MKYSIGIDIGGTTIGVGIVNQKGLVIESKYSRTDTSISPSATISKVSAQIEKLIKLTNVKEENILGIGIGAPGPLNSKEGYVINPPNLPGWEYFELKKEVEEHLPFKVIMENDANAAALAEKWVGAGKIYNDFVYITVSTGIGAGIIAKGSLLHGYIGNAGDIGHTVVDPTFGKCKCGQYGCIESIASGTAIANHSSKIIGKQITTKEAFKLYEEGHKEISEFMDKAIKSLGMLCVNLINTLDPEAIVIGGGVSQAGEMLFQPIRKYVNQYALNEIGRNTDIVPAQLKEDIGIVGAASLCIEI